jgi:hypothetical protein
MNTTSSCGDCKFWESDGGSQGSCRKHAPVRHHDSTQGVWPRTFRKDWCGEFALEKSA